MPIMPATHSLRKSYWYLISENKHLYIDIVEPIGYRAREHNDEFEKAKGGVKLKLVVEFANRFCLEDGTIDWPTLLHHTSGNYDLDQFIS